MRVLQINKFFPPVIGGVETVVQDIAEGFKDTLDIRTLVCNQQNGRTNEQINGVNVLRAKSLGTWLSMPLSFDFFTQYRKMSKHADIIQLHAPFPLADLAAFLFKRKNKLVVWWHSDIVRQKASLKLLTPFIKHTLKKADMIIVAAEEIIDSSLFLPLHRKKCRVIPYGLDFNQYPVPKTKQYFRLNDEGKIKLLFVGRLVYYKGIEILLKAMKDVNRAELFIVGQGALENKLKTIADNAGIGDTVHFIGELPGSQLRAAFYDCDIFVFPSVARSEAFGLCQLEAMYYGKPVINTQLPTAVPAVSLHGETGLTVPCGDSAALAAAINTLAEDAGLREAYGSNAARRVRERYDRRQMLKDLHNCYRKLMNI